MYSLDEINDLPPSELMEAMRWADSQCQFPGAAAEVVELRAAAARRLVEIIEAAGDRHLNLAG
jgi:hypothetical protein